MQFASKLFLVIDVGGTHIKCAIMSGAGEIIQRDTFDTPKDYDSFMAILRRQIDLNPVEAVQISLPGILDARSERTVFITNIPFLTDKHIARDLGTTLPVFLANDADMAGLGEFARGFETLPSSMILLTLGTGVGSCVVLNDQLIMGTEIGHMTLVAEGRSCNCGKKGCMEKYCSATAILADYIEGSGDHEAKSVRYVAQKAREDDFAAYGAFEFLALHLAHTIVSLVNIFNITTIRIGGGISELADLYFPSMMTMVDDMIFPPYKGKTDIKVAKLKNDAAFYGGLDWIRRGLKITHR